jgi:hypothetical protein
MRHCSPQCGRMRLSGETSTFLVMLWYSLARRLQTALLHLLDDLVFGVAYLCMHKKVCMQGHLSASSTSSVDIGVLGDELVHEGELAATRSMMEGCPAKLRSMDCECGWIVSARKGGEGRVWESVCVHGKGGRPGMAQLRFL